MKRLEDHLTANTWKVEALAEAEHASRAAEAELVERTKGVVTRPVEVRKPPAPPAVEQHVPQPAEGTLPAKSEAPRTIWIGDVQQIITPQGHLVPVTAVTDAATRAKALNAASQARTDEDAVAYIDFEKRKTIMSLVKTVVLGSRAAIREELIHVKVVAKAMRERPHRAPVAGSIEVQHSHTQALITAGPTVEEDGTDFETVFGEVRPTSRKLWSELRFKAEADVLKELDGKYQMLQTWDWKDAPTWNKEQSIPVETIAAKLASTAPREGEVALEAEEDEDVALNAATPVVCVRTAFGLLESEVNRVMFRRRQERKAARSGTPAEESTARVPPYVPNQTPLTPREREDRDCEEADMDARKQREAMRYEAKSAGLREQALTLIRENPYEAIEAYDQLNAGVVFDDDDARCHLPRRGSTFPSMPPFDPTTDVPQSWDKPLAGGPRTELQRHNRWYWSEKLSEEERDEVRRRASVAPPPGNEPGSRVDKGFKDASGLDVGYGPGSDPFGELRPDAWVSEVGVVRMRTVKDYDRRYPDDPRAAQAPTDTGRRRRSTSPRSRRDRIGPRVPERHLRGVSVSKGSFDLDRRREAERVLPGGWEADTFFQSGDQRSSWLADRAKIVPTPKAPATGVGRVRPVRMPVTYDATQEGGHVEEQVENLDTGVRGEEEERIPEPKRRPVIERGPPRQAPTRRPVIERGPPQQSSNRTVSADAYAPRSRSSQAWEASIRTASREPTYERSGNRVRYRSQEHQAYQDGQNRSLSREREPREARGTFRGASRLQGSFDPAPQTRQGSGSRAPSPFVFARAGNNTRPTRTALGGGFGVLPPSRSARADPEDDGTFTEMVTIHSGTGTEAEFAALEAR
ncbi:MAG: hypothetical protein OSB03_12950, partial [Vicinamibacterales bacterium]|nr:hypothetical protein [Vicinamibacterales bacterium]